MCNNNIQNTFVCYHGPFDIDVVSFFSNYLRQHIRANVVITGRLYKVLIELTQNVSYYSVEQFKKDRTYGSGIGYVRVVEDQDSYSITTGNKILSEHGPTLQKNTSEINSMSEMNLRELKRKTRSQANIRDIGAHIGLIQTGLLTGNNLEFSIEPINNEFSFFTITARINKN